MEQASKEEHRGGPEGRDGFQPPALRRLSGSERFGAASLAFALVVVFLIAYVLVPDPRGVGTHERLGLPPCGMMRLFGVPCPFCGMTTAFAEMMRGDPRAAFASQPAGVLLFFAGVVAEAGAVFVAVWGRWPGILTRLFRSRALPWCAFALLIAAWIYKIAHCSRWLC